MPAEFPVASARSVAGESPPAGASTATSTAETRTTTIQPAAVAVTAARPRSTAYSTREAWKMRANPTTPGASQLIASASASVTRKMAGAVGASARRTAMPTKPTTRITRVEEAASRANSPERVLASSDRCGKTAVASGTANTA